jgi:diguanylate cyclase (GGDEF)-like protein/putative nucleotidyltransferase with HDIG domain
MKDMTIPTRIYLFAIYLSGITLLVWNLSSWLIEEPVMLAILCVLASISMFIKVEGATDRSHYTFSFIVYGFTLIHLGIAASFIVVIVSSLIEWLIKRPPWYIQVFNMACYIIVLQIAGMVFYRLNPTLTLATPQDILAIVVSMIVFTCLNHLLVGIIVWMARGENFKQSGIFDPLPLVIDLSLLILGGMCVLLWNYNPYSLLLLTLPIYMIYGTMRVPSLERKTVIDQKTGLFNHTYFMDYLENELNRANRYDRPLTMIMADLDLLRNINNTYGHLAGDEVLIGIANILRQSVREYDVVARFGGEEFTILMPETTLAQGHERAEAIRHTIEQADFPISTSVEPIKVTISLGVSTREDLTQTAHEIIHNADAALYHSKLNGRNRASAISNDVYVHIKDFESITKAPQENPVVTDVALDSDESKAAAYIASTTESKKTSTPKPSSIPDAERESRKSTPVPKNSKALVYTFIGVLFTLSLLAFGGLYLSAPGIFTEPRLTSWFGIAGYAFLIVLTEWYSIDLYTKKTSLSTSAVPILAGTLLFGPIGSLILSLTYAIILGLKHRSPFNRYIFNFSNQLLAGMIYTYIISLSGGSFIELSPFLQLIFAIFSAVIVYLLNTSMISIGVYLDSRQPVLSFWREQYSWLLPIYIGMGIVAAAFVFGYQQNPIIGSLLILVPLLLLRVSQVQYVDRTRDMVSELRKKNIDLENYSDDITKLNDGLLDTLSEIIDLRDPYVLGHSRRVTNFAEELAKRLGLHKKQVELIRKGSLLHDIGKLGIPESILAKPSQLTPEEFDIIKTHPRLGAALIEKSPHLRPLIPIVLQHHEHYNGEGYPDKISGNQIAIEARIVSVADAIEAMLSDRPYRKARSKEYIIEELKNCSGRQFDPRVVEEAIYLLNEIEDESLTVKITQKAGEQLKKSTA